MVLSILEYFKPGLVLTVYVLNGSVRSCGQMNICIDGLEGFCDLLVLEKVVGKLDPNSWPKEKRKKKNRMLFF